MNWKMIRYFWEYDLINNYFLQTLWNILNNVRAERGMKILFELKKEGI